MNNGTPVMTFILGGLVVIVLVMGFFMYTGGTGHATGPTTVIDRTVNRTVAVVPRPEHHWWQFTHDDHPDHRDRPRGH